MDRQPRRRSDDDRSVDVERRLLGSGARHVSAHDARAWSVVSFLSGGLSMLLGCERWNRNAADRRPCRWSDVRTPTLDHNAHIRSEVKPKRFVARPTDETVTLAYISKAAN